MSIDEEIRRMIMERVNASQIAKAAEAAGLLLSLRAAGYHKVRAGLTTIAEVIRATTT
jgi:type II secretory ATPase GspE/PulE/Tfp pilus assembly ATPase PilB-like protein